VDLIIEKKHVEEKAYAVDGYNDNENMW